jgi:hypothetical protein
MSEGNGGSPNDGDYKSITVAWDVDERTAEMRDEDLECRGERCLWARVYKDKSLEITKQTSRGRVLEVREPFICIRGDNLDGTRGCGSKRWTYYDYQDLRYPKRHDYDRPDSWFMPAEYKGTGRLAPWAARAAFRARSAEVKLRPMKEYAE